MTDINWGDLIGAGIGLFNNRQIEEDAEQRLRRARADIYDPMKGVVDANLAAAGNFDADAFAKKRFDANQAIQQPMKEKQLADLQRMLYSQGLLGVGNYQGASPSYGPGPKGQVWQMTPGVAANPHMAAFFAAQAGAENKAAYESMDQGQAYLDKLLQRSTNAATAAAQGQAAGIQAQRQLPKSSGGIGQIAQAALPLLQKSGLFDKLFSGGNNQGWGNVGSDWWSQSLPSTWSAGVPDSYQWGSTDDGWY